MWQKLWLFAGLRCGVPGCSREAVGAGWMGRSPGPGVRLFFLLNTKLEPVKGFKQDAV